MRFDSVSEVSSQFSISKIVNIFSSRCEVSSQCVGFKPASEVSINYVNFQVSEYIFDPVCSKPISGFSS